MPKTTSEVPLLVDLTSEVAGTLPVANGGTGFTSISRVRAYRATSNQSIPDNNATKVELNAISYDNLNEFNTTTNRFTALSAGYYLICGGIYYLNVYDGKNYGIRFQDGVTALTMLDLSAGDPGHQDVAVSDIHYLSAGQYIELFAYHVTGVARNISYSESRTYMSIHRLS